MVNQKMVILAIFDGVGQFWGQFWATKLHPIDSTIESGMVRHTLKKILGLGQEGIRPARPEIQGKMRDFQNGQL